MTDVACLFHRVLGDESDFTFPEDSACSANCNQQVRPGWTVIAEGQQSVIACGLTPHQPTSISFILQQFAQSVGRICFSSRDLQQFVVVLTVGFGLLSQSVAIAKEPLTTPILTGPTLRKELDRPFAASWAGDEFRAVLKQVESDRQISILLDRRIDPSTEYAFDINAGSLRDGLTVMAKRVDAELSLLDSSVFVGPPRASRSLRTLIDLRTSELRSKEAAVPDRRRAELVRRRSIRWPDLQTPREVLTEISHQFQLTITNLESIPHDLWGAAIIPEAPAAEALSIVLVQLDLTFQWEDHGQAIVLVPLPQAVHVERKHRSKQKLTEAVALVHQNFPGLDVQSSSSEILIKGTVEEQEAIASLLRGERSAKSVDPSAPLPIRERLFTFSVDGPVPISAVMQKLEESGIRFEFDAEEFQRAGIDLERKIELRHNKATPNEFFKSLFAAAGLEFQIDLLTVKLKPKSK